MGKGNVKMDLSYVQISIRELLIMIILFSVCVSFFFVYFQLTLAMNLFMCKMRKLTLHENFHQFISVFQVYKEKTPVIFYSCCKN